MNILITGAGSFIGSFFKEKNPSDTICEVDLLSTDIDDIDFSGYDVVFHVAAIVHQDESLSDDIYFSVNRDLAVKVAEAAKRNNVKQFLFMSTVKVYGENSTVEEPWDEATICFPQDAYGKSKLEAESLLLELNSDDFVVSIVRTPVVYGKGVKGNIARMTNFVKRYYTIPFGGINNKRAMVYIGNLAAMLKCIMDKRCAGIFLANDAETVSTSLFVKTLILAMKKKRFVLVIPTFVQQILKVLIPKLYQRIFGSMVLDNSKTNEKLDFTPPYTMLEGMKEYL